MRRERGRIPLLSPYVPIRQKLCTKKTQYKLGRELLIRRPQSVDKNLRPRQRCVSDTTQSDHHGWQQPPFRKDVSSEASSTQQTSGDLHYATLSNRILIAIAASAVLTMAGPVALTAVSPAAYANDSATSADGAGDSADAGHSTDGKGDKGDSKGDKGQSKGDKGQSKGDSKGDKGQSKGDSKGQSKGDGKGGDSGHSGRRLGPLERARRHRSSLNLTEHTKEESGSASRASIFKREAKTRNPIIARAKRHERNSPESRVSPRLDSRRPRGDRHPRASSRRSAAREKMAAATVLVRPDGTMRSCVSSSNGGGHRLVAACKYLKQDIIAQTDN
jgi:hypothetical protein